jgi:hypothetical protein
MKRGSVLLAFAIGTILGATTTEAWLLPDRLDLQRRLDYATEQGNVWKDLAVSRQQETEELAKRLEEIACAADSR